MKYYCSTNGISETIECLHTIYMTYQLGLNLTNVCLISCTMLVNETTYTHTIWYTSKDGVRTPTATDIGNF